MNDPASDSRSRATVGSTRTSESGGTDSIIQENRSRRDERLILALLMLLCAGLRIASQVYFADSLDDDRDGYLAIADGLAAGRGYSLPGTASPTAYRPPLYPLLLAPLTGTHQRWLVASLHILLSLGTLWLLWQSARQLSLGLASSILAGILYCCDPLALRYVAYPMTETLCMTLAAALLCCLTAARRTGWQSSILIGITFGLCVLARPTFWIFGGLRAGLTLLFGAKHSRGSGNERRRFGRLLLPAIATALVVLPWVIRNVLVMGAPVLMTTHGGYTLLLGNNEAFYREVVQQPWGTTWDGSHGPGQAAWYAGIQKELDEQGLHSEVAHDRWMSQRAWSTIRRHPVLFARACLIKAAWFWNVVPHASASEHVPRILSWGVAIFYSLEWLALLLGLLRVGRAWRRRPEADRWSAFPWLEPALLIVAFSLPHLAYWSDARMRAPLVPAIALLAAYGATGLMSLRRPAKST